MTSAQANRKPGVDVTNEFCHCLNCLFLQIYRNVKSSANHQHSLIYLIKAPRSKYATLELCACQFSCCYDCSVVNYNHVTQGRYERFESLGLTTIHSSFPVHKRNPLYTVYDASSLKATTALIHNTIFVGFHYPNILSASL